MSRTEQSIVVRGWRRTLSVLTDAGHRSLTGRILVALGTACSNSVSIGTRGIRSLPIETPGLPMSLAVVARPYVWARHRLAEGATGRAFDRLSVWASHSAFRSGDWVRLLGATLVGMGCGRAADSPVVTSAALAVSGVALVAWGPWLLRASKSSMVFGGLLGGRAPSAHAVTLEPDAPTSKWIIWAGVAVCAASGAAAGATGGDGPVWFAAGVVVVAVLVTLMWRPEGVLLIAAAFPWANALARATLGGLGAAWDEILLLGAIALLLWGALVTGRLRLRTVPITLPAAAMLVAAVGSIVVNKVPTDIGVFALRVTLEPLLFYFAGFLLFTSVSWLRGVVAVFMASTTALAVHGIYQFWTGVETPEEWLDSSEIETITTRAFSVIGNPNGLGAVLAIGIVIGVALLLSSSINKRWRVALGAAIAVQLVGIAVTFSRSSWIGAVSGLVAVLLLAHRRYLVGVAAVAAVGVLATPKVFVDRFLLAFSYSYLTKASVDGRLYRWSVAYNRMFEHPWFGVGLGTFGGSSAARFGYISRWVDNYYLQMGAEGGLLLLASFLWLVVRVAKGLFKALKLTDDPFVRVLAAGVLGALVTIMVANIFVSALETLALGAALWLLCGMTTAAALGRETVRPS